MHKYQELLDKIQALIPAAEKAWDLTPPFDERSRKQDPLAPPRSYYIFLCYANEQWHDVVIRKKDLFASIRYTADHFDGFYDFVKDYVESHEPLTFKSRCECGSDKTYGSGPHSHWCPEYK